MRLRPPTRDEQWAEAEKVALPTGYELASLADHGPSAKAGRWSAQLLNKRLVDIPRGTGATPAAAVRDAIQNVGGDDGLSARFRLALGPTAGRA